jgi:nitrate/nitrite-specific signal transduction histidine kinase
VLILDAYGMIVAAEPERSEAVGQDWSDRAYYRQMLGLETSSLPGPVFSDIVSDGPGGTQVIVVAVPIVGDRGQFQGVMAGMFRAGATSISTFYGDILKLRLGDKGSAYLVDGQGLVIYHADPKRVGDSFLSQGVVQQVLNGEVGAVRTRDLDGQEIVASFAPIPNTSWGLVNEESWSALLSSSQGYQRFLLLLLLLGVVLPAIVVAIGVRRLTKPITELIEAAQNVAQGDFGRKITAQTGDEIEELARQFNIMSARLQESYANLEQRVTDRTKELAALNAIASVVSQSLYLDELLDDAVDKTLQVMEIEAGGIYLLDEATGLLMITTYKGFSPQFIAAVDKLRVGEGFSGSVVQSGKPLVVTDVAADPRLTRSVVREEGLGSLAIAPLSSKGKVLGTLFTMTYGHRDFTDQDIQLLTSIGHQIGVAVDSARLFRAEQRRADQFHVINEVGRRIASILDVDELLVQVVQLIQQAFAYDHVGIALIENGQAIYKVGAGALWDDPEFRFEPRRLKVGEEGITGWVAASGEPLLIPDVSQEPRYVWMRGSATRSELAVPLAIKGEVTGVLDVQSNQLNAFDESDLLVLQSLAHQAAIAIENARLFHDTTRQVRELQALADASRIVSSVLDREQLLQALYEQITRIAPADFYLIALYDEATNQVSIEISVDEGIHYPKEQYVLDKGLLHRIIHGQQPLRFDSLTEEKDELGIEIIPAGSAKMNHGWLGVPMLYSNKVMGAVIVGSYERGTFDAGHQQILTSIASQAAVALENAQLYEQAQQLAVVEERQRLARELHDAVTQTLFSASLIAETLPQIWESDQDEGLQLLSELRQLSRGALAEMRTLLLELRPAALVEAPLPDLLRQLGEAVTGRTGIPVKVTVESECTFPSSVHVALYRIVQEALNNVVKHANAYQVAVSLSCVPVLTGVDDEWQDRVELQVSDDGCGFDPSNIPSDRLGLGIIRERAQAIGATLEIDSEPGSGTRIHVVWLARSAPHKTGTR